MTSVRRKTDGVVSSTMTPSATKAKIRDVLYQPIFEASQLIQDEFWRDFFIDLSKGRQQRKIHIDDKYVSHSGKKVSFNYCYTKKTPHEISTELRRLLSDTLCMYSETDMLSERETMNAYASEFKDNKNEDDWKKVKNKKFKDHLITSYVLRMSEEHKLKNPRVLYSTIINALFVYRTHKSSDITLVDGEITSIDDIIITHDKISNERLQDFDDCVDRNVIRKTNWSKEWLKACNAIVKQSKHFLCIDIEDPKKKKKPLVPSQKKLALPDGEDTQMVDADEVMKEDDAEQLMNEMDELAELNTGFPDECNDECNDDEEDEDEPFGEEDEVEEEDEEVDDDADVQ